MVKFEGPFHLKKGKTNKHDITIPNYIGSVRAMVVSGFNGAYGITENTVPVRKPLMVLSTLPRVVGPGEDVLVPVTVFAMDDNIRNVDVLLETNEMFRTDAEQQRISFTQTGDKLVYFNLSVKEKIGKGKVKVTVSSGNEKARHEIEIDVRPSNPETTEFVYAALEPGESWQQEILLPGMKGTNSLILEVFSIPPFDFGRRLKFLMQYPHGCLEQITSSAFPQLYLSDIMEANEVRDEMTEKNVKSAIKKLGDFRLSSGGFPYWPKATAENEWVTNYAGHFLLEAKEKGYEIPEDWINSWVRYQRKIARRWTGKSYESLWHKRAQYMTQAYRLYTLALAGNPEIASMNRLRERIDVPVMASWHLIAAYALAGKEELAREMMNQLTTEIPDYNSRQLYTYGSSIRDKSVILNVLNLLKEKEKAIPVLQYITENLSSDNWYSTHSTAFALMAVAKYIGKNNSSAGVDFEYRFITN
jgi:hypothetical protein